MQVYLCSKDLKITLPRFLDFEGNEDFRGFCDGCPEFQEGILTHYLFKKSR